MSQNRILSLIDTLSKMRSYTLSLTDRSFVIWPPLKCIRVERDLLTCMGSEVQMRNIYIATLSLIGIALLTGCDSGSQQQAQAQANQCWSNGQTMQQCAQANGLSSYIAAKKEAPPAGANGSIASGTLPATTPVGEAPIPITTAAIQAQALKVKDALRADSLNPESLYFDPPTAERSPSSIGNKDTAYQAASVSAPVQQLEESVGSETSSAAR